MRKKRGEKKGIPVESDWLVKIKDIRYKRVLKLIIDESPNSVLDIGCSEGGISSFLVDGKRKIYGIDISAEKIDKASAKGIIVKAGDVSKGLPYDDNSFDIVLAAEIIEHLIDTDYFLEEIYRVLKENGKLVITTPNLANLENRLRLLIGRYPIFVDYTSRGDNHLRVYTARALIKQLKEKGFKIEYYTGSFLPPISYMCLKNISLLLMPFLGFLGFLLPSLAIHTIIKAGKSTCFLSQERIKKNKSIPKLKS